MPATTVNARTNVTGLPYNSNLKRKTMADRAGEFARPAPSPPKHRPTNGQIRTTSLANASRDFSSSSNFSRSTSSASSRTISSSTLSNSVGPGSRQTYAQSRRPRSALGTSRMQKPNFTQSRPATSMETHQEEAVGQTDPDQRMCRNPISSFPPHMNCGALGITLPRRRPIPALSHHPDTPMTRREMSISTGLRNMTLNDTSTQMASRLKSSECTPSRLPKAPPMTPVPLPSPSPSPKKRSVKSSNQSTAFLSKSTNLKSAWDRTDRMQDAERTMQQFFTRLNNVGEERNEFESLVSFYKGQGTLFKIASFAKLIQFRLK